MGDITRYSPQQSLTERDPALSSFIQVCQRGLFFNSEIFYEATLTNPHPTPLENTDAKNAIGLSLDGVVETVVEGFRLKAQAAIPPLGGSDVLSAHTSLSGNAIFKGFSEHHEEGTRDPVEVFCDNLRRFLNNALRGIEHASQPVHVVMFRRRENSETF